MPRDKIRLTLIHNDAAGDADHGRYWLVDLLSQTGYQVTYVPYEPSSIAAALAAPCDLIAVAGGDGTIATVAAAAAHNGPPIAILPLGTANNLAKAIGVALPLDDLVAGWSTATPRPFYPIDSDGPWGSRRLVEGLGFGAIEEAIAGLPDKTDRASACRSYAAAVLDCLPETLEIRIDGETIAGSFAMVEVSTVPLLGPNLRLAAGADPHDREFEISFIRDDIHDRRALAEWIDGPDCGAPAPVSLRVVERAVISGEFRRVRLDGRVRTTKPSRGWDYSRPIVLATAVHPIHFLVPEPR